MASVLHQGDGTFEWAVKRILNRLEKVRRRGRGWTARCPAHHDRFPSLSIAVSGDGKILLYCFADCTVQKIVAALGLSMRDLFCD